MRQRILQIPHSYARQLLGITDVKVMSGKLREMSISILNDIKNLPQQVTDPNWLDTLEGDSGQSETVGPRKASGSKSMVRIADLR